MTGRGFSGTGGFRPVVCNARPGDLVLSSRSSLLVDRKDQCHLERARLRPGQTACFFLLTASSRSVACWSNFGARVPVGVVAGSFALGRSPALLCPVVLMPVPMLALRILAI